MGGKKKGGGKGKGKGKSSAESEEDIALQIEQFFRVYKKKYTEYDVAMCQAMKDKKDLFDEDQEIPAKFHIWQELGWPGTRAIMDALRDTKYKYCTSIRFWKTYCEDEGVRAIC